MSEPTMEELESLPEGTLVRSHNGTVYSAVNYQVGKEQYKRAWYADMLGAGLSTESLLESATIEIVDADYFTTSSPAFSVTAEHLKQQQDFSQRTFGAEPRVAGVIDHIRKELKEVEANPNDLSEWADVLILAFDGALRSGWEPQEILDAIQAKQTRNESRTWPDWRTAEPDKAIEHIE